MKSISRAVWSAFGIGVFIGALLAASLSGVWDGQLLRALLPHVITAVVVYVLVDQTYLRRYSATQSQELRTRLLQQVAGQSNHLAMQGIRDMRTHGWLTGEDGLLAGSDLTNADLHDIDLSNAQLTGVRLGGATLHGANFTEAAMKDAELFSASMKGAVFIGADLSGANMFGAKLTRATLREAKCAGADFSYAAMDTADCDGVDFSEAKLLSTTLRGTGLRGANLRGATLTNTDLMNADLTDAQLDQTTILPDGTTWTPQTDLGRFTDSDHTDFWRSASKLSPAYVQDDRKSADTGSKPLFNITFPQERGE
ncbi:MAG: pentapeptide repeat-containing protein [Chloroflexota bacterium]